MNNTTSQVGLTSMDNDFRKIHLKKTNIVSHKRDVRNIQTEIPRLVQNNVSFQLTGSLSEISANLMENPIFSNSSLFAEDVLELSKSFQGITNSSILQLYITTVNTNMCRRFHSDVNDIRLLCTYYGQGTLWLDNQNVNQSALLSGANNDEIVINPELINQAQPGEVLLLKGSIYPNLSTFPIVHRSPTIEESGEKRLLLRIDTNEFLNLKKRKNNITIK